MTSIFAGRCGGYILQVDANEGDLVQVWLTYSGEFLNQTDHPLVQRSDATMMVLEAKSNPFIGGVTIEIPYNVCQENIYISYRYITADQSSPLFTLSITPESSNTTPWIQICDCGFSSPGADLFFIIDDCIITDIIYSNLEPGEKLHHKEIKTPSSGANQLLHEDIHSIITENHTYDLAYPTTTDKIDLRVKETDPWSTLNLSNVPCMSTNNSSSSGSEKEDLTSQDGATITALRLYPNPTQNHLMVETAESATLLLIGVDGKSHDLRDLTTTRFGYRFSTSHLTPGIYFLRSIHSTGEVYTEKFIVQR